MDTTHITLTGEEINLSVNALDFYSRIWIGQYDEILWNHRMFLDHKEVGKIEDNVTLFLQMVRMLVLPDLGPELNGSYGIYNPVIDKKAQLAYNMQQVIRYKYAYAKYPEGGIQVDVNDKKNPRNNRRDERRFRHSKIRRRMGKLP